MSTDPASVTSLLSFDVCLETLFMGIAWCAAAASDLLAERVVLAREVAPRHWFLTRASLLWAWAARLVFSSQYDWAVAFALSCWPLSFIRNYMHYWFLPLSPRSIAGAGVGRLQRQELGSEHEVHAHVLGSVSLDTHEIGIATLALYIGIFYVARLALRLALRSFLYRLPLVIQAQQSAALSAARLAAADESIRSSADVNARFFVDSARFFVNHGLVVAVIAGSNMAGLLPHFAFSAMMWLEWVHAWFEFRVTLALGAHATESRGSSAGDGERASPATEVFWTREVGALGGCNAPCPAVGGAPLGAFLWFLDSYVWLAAHVVFSRKQLGTNTSKARSD